MSEQTITAIVVALIGTIIGPMLVAYATAKFQTAKSIKKISETVPSWELLFEHDENGNRIRGSIDHLIETVGNAYPIKVKIYREKNNFEMMDAQWVFVDNNLVEATNIDQISLTKDASGNYVYHDNPYHYFVVVGSEGNHHATRIYLDGKKRNTSDSKRHMAWFGLVPPS
jgi:hypothetical protein